MGASKFVSDGAVGRMTFKNCSLLLVKIRFNAIALRPAV
jgi:hypothetical protein